MNEINIGDLVLHVDYHDGEQSLGMIVHKQNDADDGCYEWWNVQWLDGDNKIGGYNTNTILGMKENLKLIYGTR